MHCRWVCTLMHPLWKIVWSFLRKSKIELCDSASSLLSIYWKRLFAVQSLSHVQLFAVPWTAACQASLSFTLSRTLLRFMSIESEMLFNHHVLCCPLLLQPSVFPSIRVFSNGSAFCFGWPKCWSFSFSTSPSNEYLGFISFRIDQFDLLAGKKKYKFEL